MKHNQILYVGLDPARLGTPVTHVPFIRTSLVKESAVFFAEHEKWTHVVLTSRSAVCYFFQIVRTLQLCLSHHTFLVVGKATQECLKQEGDFPCLVASDECAEGVVDILHTLDKQSVVFYPHSALARNVIGDFLKENFPRSISCVLYETHAIKPQPLPDLKLFSEIVFSSPSTVEAVVEAYGALPELPLRAIGPITQKKLDSFRKCPIVSRENRDYSATTEP